jgi:hypothetical protein
VSFEKFLRTISRLLPATPCAVNAEAIAQLDPNKIYPENVRSVLGVSTGSAERICETAVRQGVFSRFVEVSCPDGAVAISAPTEAELPEMVSCWQETDADYEEVEFSTRDLPKRVFYRMNDVEATAGPHARTA